MSTTVVVGTVTQPPNQGNVGKAINYLSSFVFTPTVIPCPAQSFSINQPNTMFSCASQEGITMCPVRDATQATTIPLRGAVHAVSQLLETETFAVSGNLPDIGANRNDVCLFHGGTIRAIASVDNPILCLQILSDCVVVVTLFEVAVFRLDGRVVSKCVTHENPWGIFGVFGTALTGSQILVPNPVAGQVGVYSASNGTQRYFVSAHNHKIGLIQISSDGSVFVTASEGSTNLKLWCRTTGQVIRELRRGTIQCRSYCAAFDPKLKHLAVLSAHGTLHVFSLGRREPPRPYEIAAEKRNTESTLKPLAPVVSYFDSEWSVHSLTLSQELIGIPGVLSFTAEGEIVLLNAKGVYSSYLWDSVKGELTASTKQDIPMGPT
eukprot:PhF_6_TR11233/c0_g1_i1/m.18109